MIKVESLARRNVTCKTCDAVLSFDATDIKTKVEYAGGFYNPSYENLKYIVCPICKSVVRIK